MPHPPAATPVASPAGLSAVARGGVRISAPGRLHLGFLDPSASLGRPFGSLGLVIEGPRTVVDLAPAARDDDLADDPAAAAELTRARAHIATLRAATGQRTPLHLRLGGVLPAHAGFGSGTQLALAVGRAFCTVHGLTIDTATLAHLLGRGRRSGVGIAGFDHGGLLLDGGPGADGRPAPLLSRLTLPTRWPILLVLDPGAHGLSGTDERAALATLPPLPRDLAAQVCHQVLMQVLPGAAGGEFGPFAAGLTAVQALLGNHFAPAQGGRAFTSARVERAVTALAAAGPAASGQSSWGPTGFVVLPSAEAAEAALSRAGSAGAIDPALRVLTVTARNHGATVHPLPSRDGRRDPQAAEARRTTKET